MEANNTPIEIEQSLLTDSSLEDTMVFQSLTSAIFGDDQEQFDQVLHDLFDYALSVETHYLFQQEPPPARSFNLIPGLKDVLIQFWEREFSSTVYESDDFERNLPVWEKVPKILSVLFPGDEEVHELIWKRHNPDQPSMTIVLLDNGRFLTPEANKLRVDTLLNTSSSASLFAYSAARSLGISQSTEGFDALLETLQRSTDLVLISFVVEAIVAYGFDAVKFKQEITEKAAGFGISLPSEVVEIPKQFVQSYGFLIYMYNTEAATNRLVRSLKHLVRLERYGDRIAAQSKEPGQTRD